MKIVVIPGDGIGREIVDSATRVVKAVAKKQNITIEYVEKSAGGDALDKFGVPLPEDTVDACKNADATLLGAVGGPKWDNVKPELRAEKAILGLRKAMGLYINLRPIKVYDSLIDFSPLRPERILGTDLIIVRELTGGIYFGEKKEAYINDDGIETAWDVEEYNANEVSRIVHYAMKTAATRRKKVTSVEKSNVLASSRLWKKTAVKVSKEYPDIELESMYVDNCAMQLVLNPKDFDVVVTSNLFGDILSDEAAIITGSIGMLPSASIGDGPGLYEPIHGSAPDIAGKGFANPLGTILSTAMMFRYSLNNDGAATEIERAVDNVLGKGFRTIDLYREGNTKVSTEEMAKLVEKEIG